MIKLEKAHIEEMRGIRKLDIDFSKKTFAISGPNGSGKSGVIDAIEFGLTGEIGRLTGRGTGGLSISEHGPHVDKTKFPGAAFVQLHVFLTALNKSVKITRKINSPKKPLIEPADADVLAVLAEVADHPEIALSRREILRFILVEPTKRSEEIQAILKLDEIGQIRATLNTTQNRLQSTQKTAETAVSTAGTSLKTHLQITTLSATGLLEAVNQRRKLLGLTEIAELTAETKLDVGLTASATASAFNKQSALGDLKALSDAAEGFSEIGKTPATAILTDLEKLEGDPGLLAALQRRAFIEKGLELVDGPDCPLCDASWDDEQHLRDHLSAKLEKSEEARKLQDRLLENGTALSGEIIKADGLLGPIQKLADGEAEKAFAQLLNEWKTDLADLRGKLASVDGLTGLKARLEGDWLGVPKEFGASLTAFTVKIEAKPDQTTTIDAQTFLSTAQVRLHDYRVAQTKQNGAKKAAVAAKAAYDAYCDVMVEELDALYEAVQDDFSKFYRAINSDDESSFTAKLTASEGKLEFGVNFYDRGLFPPGAFHSEGHQDGMGVCLYLALMKRLFGDTFGFAMLDDVVMSVDTDHRYEFCKLLKSEFPNTQFIITTHDRLWAEQMRSAGLVTSKTSLAFHSWSIDTGPLVESNDDIWADIDAQLAKGKAEIAAASLRRHLEYVSRLLADQLGASVQFRADGNFELGDLLPNVLSRIDALYGRAATAAQSWGNLELRDAIAARRAALSKAKASSNVEQWAVNKALHYNEWANFGKKDFEPVVAALKELLSFLLCPKCLSWLHVIPRGSHPESLRCGCADLNFNLKAKDK